MITDGSPVIRSTASWIGARSHGEAYSSRKTAMHTPIGSEIAVAIPTRIAEPTIKGAIPPPGTKGTGKSLVRNVQESSLAPRLATARTTSASTPSAARAAIVAIASATRLAIFRRRTRASPCSVSAGSNVAISVPRARGSGGRSPARSDS